MRFKLDECAIGAFDIISPTALWQIIGYPPDTVCDSLNNAGSPQRLETPDVCFDKDLRILIRASISLRKGQVRRNVVETAVSMGHRNTRTKYIRWRLPVQSLSRSCI
jgi:hypothetical protein